MPKHLMRPATEPGDSGRRPRSATSPSHPILLARRLERRHRWQQRLATCTNARWLSLALAAGASLIAFAGWRLLRMQGAALLEPLREHPFSVAAITAVMAAALVLQGRRRAERQFAQSWLASAPIERGEVLAALRRRIAGEVGLALAGVLALIALSGFASGVAVRWVLAAIALGGGLGAVAGWRSGARAPRARAEPFVRLAPARGTTSLAAGLDALARWPFAQLRAAANPRLHAYLVGAVLVSLPHGVPLRFAIPALLLSVVALAAQALLMATLRVMPAAADWLRSTPLGHAAFLRALCLRGCAWQGAAALCASVLLHALGVSAPQAIACGAIWLAWCATALATTWVRRFQPRRARLEVWALGVVLLALASVAWPLPIAVLPALWSWQWRRLETA